MANETKTYLGQILVEKKVITQEQLEQALRKQKETGEMLGAILLKLGFISEEAIFIPIVADQWGVEHINLKAIEIEPDVIKGQQLDDRETGLFAPVDQKLQVWNFSDPNALLGIQRKKRRRHAGTPPGTHFFPYLPASGT